MLPGRTCDSALAKGTLPEIVTLEAETGRGRFKSLVPVSGLHLVTLQRAFHAQDAAMLRFAEEIILLLLDEERGELAPNLPPHSLNIVLAGAVLMDLALEDRIDTDLEQLMLVDSTPLEDDLLDPTLAAIAGESTVRDARFWVTHEAGRGDEIREKALARLASRGILEPVPEEFFFFSSLVSRARRYPMIDGKTAEDVQLRVMRILFSDDIPDPRDVVIICLADACGIFERLLSKEEQDQVRERIELVGQLDLIGRSVSRAIRELEPPPASPRPRKDIPRAPGLPLIGNTIGMAGDLTSFLVDQYRSLGPVFRIQAFNRRFIVLAGPEANVFAKRGSVFFRTLEGWVDYNSAVGAGRVVASIDGPEHVRLRKEVSFGYSLNLMEGRLDEAIRVIREDVARWPQDKPLPGLPVWQHIVVEQLGVLSTSMSLREYMTDILVFTENMLATHVARVQPKWMLYRPRVRRAAKRMDELARRILAAHEPEKRLDKPRDAVDRLLDLHSRDPQFMPETDLHEQVLGPFVASIDTAAAVCSFMFYELLRQPDLRARVAAEADALFAGGTPSVGALRELDVIRRAAMETMRLYPVSPALLPRTVSNSFEFEGYRIPAGEKVLVANTMPLRMPEYFPDPQRFDIDRYTAERAEHRQPGAYVPFGVGAHTCLGGRLAQALIALNMAIIFREAEFALHPPDCKLKTRQKLTLHPSFKFRLTSRPQ